MSATLTELDAINEVLSFLGERPLNSLADMPVDGLQTQSKLQIVSKRLQSRQGGWWFNSEDNYELQVDGSGRFAVPLDVVVVEEVEGKVGDQLAVRNGYLWNRAENTDIWTIATRTVLLVRLISFTGLPYEMQAYCVAQAAAELASSFGMGSDDRRELVVGAVRAKGQVEATHSRQQPLNLRNTPYHQRGLRGRTSPLDNLNR